MKLVLPKTASWLNYDALPYHIEGDVEYLADFCIRGGYSPVVVMVAKNPNKQKGHKKYPFIVGQDGKVMIGGMAEEEMSQYRTQSALHCHGCDEIIYSTFRHDYRECSCKASFVDGGRDYFRYGHSDINKVTVGVIDFIDKKFIPNKPAKKDGLLTFLFKGFLKRL